MLFRSSTQPHLRELLKDPHRAEQLHASGAGITLDYSRQRVTADVLQQLSALADESHVMDQAKAMFRGDPINATEQRAVLHVALRGSHVPNPPWGADISKQVANELLRVCMFAEKVREIVRRIPKGEQMTYKEVAKKAGKARAARAVGAIMRTNFDPEIPCHRVVRSDGSMGGYNRGGSARKKEILKAEKASIGLQN